MAILFPVVISLAQAIKGFLNPYLKTSKYYTLQCNMFKSLSSSLLICATFKHFSHISALPKLTLFTKYPCPLCDKAIKDLESALDRVSHVFVVLVCVFAMYVQVEFCLGIYLLLDSCGYTYLLTPMWCVLGYRSYLSTSVRTR